MIVKIFFERYWKATGNMFNRDIGATLKTLGRYWNLFKLSFPPFKATAHCVCVWKDRGCLFIKYWSHNQWTIPHTKQNKGAEPHYHNQIYLSVMSRRCCCVHSFTFVISTTGEFCHLLGGEIGDCSSLQSRDILRTIWQNSSNSIFLTGPCHCSAHNLFGALNIFQEAATMLNINNHAC